MAKRNRGSHRPGQRRSDRHAARQQPRPAQRPAQGLTDAEEARAAELESQILAQRSAGAPEAAVSRSEDGFVAQAPRVGSPLALKAATEYAYVARDVRRIVRIGGSMLALLGVVFVAVRVLHLVSI